MQNEVVTNHNGLISVTFGSRYNTVAQDVVAW